MKSFKLFLSEANNTDKADVNEILLGWYLLNNSWTNFEGDTEARKQLQDKLAKIGEVEFEAQSVRALSMAQEVEKWAPLNGYKGKITKAWWTARPGVLAKAVGRDVDSRKNPTDILVQFSDGKFLGLSAKSTKTKGDIGFKNPGAGTVASETGIDIAQHVDEAVAALLTMFPELSKVASQRKGEIRKGDSYIVNADLLGGIVLNKIREDLYNKLKSMTQASLKDYLLDSWMDAKNEVYPPYIKITGMKGSSKIEDPLKNDKLAAIYKGSILLTKVGNDSIGVSVNLGNTVKRIMKMRAKYESQKLASPVKFSGDPWK